MDDWELRRREHIIIIESFGLGLSAPHVVDHMFRVATSDRTGMATLNLFVVVFILFPRASIHFIACRRIGLALLYSHYPFGCQDPIFQLPPLLMLWNFVSQYLFGYIHTIWCNARLSRFRLLFILSKERMKCLSASLYLCRWQQRINCRMRNWKRPDWYVEFITT